MVRRAVFALAFCGFASGPSLAHGAIAVGVPARGPYYGFSWGAAADAASVDEGTTRAVRICRGQDPVYRASPKADLTEAQSRCTVVGTFKDQCAGMAFNGEVEQNIAATAYGWAIAFDSNTVNSQALARCEAMRAGRGRTCHFDAFICDGNAK